MDDVSTMAAFVALEVAGNEGTAAGYKWLESVIDEPSKWQREARAFEVMTNNDEGGAHKYERAAAAIYALMGPSNAS